MSCVKISKLYLSHRKLFCTFLVVGLLTQTVKILTTNYKAKTEVYFKTVFNSVHTI